MFATISFVTEAELKEPLIELAQYRLYKYNIASGKLTTLYVPSDENVYSVDWISDDVLLVSCKTKSNVGMLKQ
ncbi:hypothetical protein F4212_05745 [Candidatus Poribacteria bacterium]|nr:hypothetical protein [Candidatus Poribacteria bacterium]